MLAVIKTGGKQYIVSPGQKIKIEKIDKKEKRPTPIIVPASRLIA